MLPDWFWYAFAAVSIFITAFFFGYVPFRKKEIGIHECYGDVRVDIPDVGNNLPIEYINSIKRTVKVAELEGEIPMFIPRLTAFPYDESDAVVADESRWFMIYSPVFNKIDRGMLAHLRSKIPDAKFKELQELIEKDKSEEILIKIADYTGMSESLKGVTTVGTYVQSQVPGSRYPSSFRE